ncbi:MAG: hypothetical protein CMJ33_09475 [Phycisphaerae bacterium]|nr:hypothetical protein [Phycisphaerae bacterium]
MARSRDSEPSDGPGGCFTMMPIRILILLGTLLITVVWCSGCGGGKPNPVSSNISYGPNDDFATRILDRSERRRILSIMEASVVGPTDDGARPAPYGVRWKDVHSAAIAAGATLELAVLSVESDSEGTLKTVELISIREVPVTLLVRRAPPPEIYTATATAGLFEDQVELADRFLDAFNVSMRNFGRKPGWIEMTNE